jgi:alpha-beta hydrolase superfamily lysophospholipase
MIAGLAAISPRLANTESEVQFKGMGGLMLSGTFVQPAATFSGPGPAVLLLPGSGPTDRDGNQLAGGLRTDLLKQIAEQLAANGIASLRFDKRAVHRYAADWPKSIDAIATFFDWSMFTGDATAAYQFLRVQPGVAASKVAVCGHSEGGLIALAVAHDLSSTPDEPAALVLLSTAGRPLGEVLHEQLAAKLPSQTDPDTAKALLAFSDRATAELSAGKPLPPDVPRALLGLYGPSTPKYLGAVLPLDPAKLAAAYDRNVLIVNGIDDTQVSPKLDATRLRDAFERRRTGSVKLVLVPQASHNYKSTAAGNADAFEGPASTILFAAMTKFLKDNLSP